MPAFVITGKFKNGIKAFGEKETKTKERAMRDLSKCGPFCKVTEFLKSNRNIYILLFISICISSSYAADIRSVKSGFWSETSTWDSGQVPGDGDNVVVDSGHVVTYNVQSSEAIRLLLIRGKLTFSRTENTQLDVGMIFITTRESVDPNEDCSMHMHGPMWMDAPKPALEVGSVDKPIPNGVTARIRLVHFSGIDPNCSPGIICYGGSMDFHGAPINKTWTKLAQSAPEGATTIKLSDAVDWKVGDHIVITRSQRVPGNSVSLGSFRTNGRQQSEERFISAINGTVITLDAPLEHDHPRFVNRYAAEVANLSRNVVVESKDPNGERGHTMYHHGSQGSISYAEFRHLGKDGVLARYPIHYHKMRNSMRGSSVIGASIWDSHNRFVTIHGTDYIVVRDCVGFKSIGHGYFMEDATEVYNFLENNLAILTYDSDPLPDQALDFDPNDGAGYWWANGRNAFINNVASETDDYGFRFEIPEDFFESILQPDGTIQTGVEVNSLSFIRFKGNEVHGTMKYGIRFDGHPDQKDPLVIEDMNIWQVWYAFRPDMYNYYIKNLNIWNTAYGFYGREPGAGRVEGYTATHIGNYVAGFQDSPQGLITFENVTADSVGEYPIRIYGQEERNESCDVHFRNLSLSNVSEGWDGARAQDPKESPALTLYLHDFFGTNIDAKVIPDNQSRSDGLDYLNLSPRFDGVKVARANVGFPVNPVEVIDNLPPATVILYPRNGQVFDTQTSQIVVRGTCIDGSNITSLKVNGVPVTPLADNFSRWQVTLSNFSSSDYDIVTEAKDEHGNIELTPHKITIGFGTFPTATDDDPQEPVNATTYQLHNNYPNPFNPETTLRYTVSGNSGAPSEIRITIFDALGHRVRELVNTVQNSGDYSVVWNARDDDGKQVASGVYLYQFLAKNIQNGQTFREIRKMSLVR